MSKKVIFLFPVVMTIVVAITAIFWKTEHSPKEITDTPDARQIMAVMEQAYQLMGSAALIFDVSDFPTVFIDTEDYKLTDQQKETMAQSLGLNVTEMENVGYLTAMQAQYVSRGQGARLLQEALDKAKSEGRDLTKAEFQEIVKANHDQLPTLNSPVTTKTELVFNSIEIDGNRAVIRYDDGAALQEAILVKVSEQWFIASIVPIWIHF